MRKRFIMKEVTCPTCEGYGFYDNEYGMQPILADELEEYKCPHCKGKGYVIDAKDTITGYRVYTLEEGM